MKTKTILLLILLVSFCLGASFEPMNCDSANINGTVTVGNDSPEYNSFSDGGYNPGITIEGAVVTISSSDGFLSSTTTNVHGTYAFEDLAFNQYMISASSNGYKDSGARELDIDYFNGSVSCDDQDVFDISLEEENQPPNIPSITSGSTSGSVDVSYNFEASTTDPNDEDQVQYQFDWDDENVSNWTNSVPSGSSSGIVQHSWSLVGTYNIKVQAKDNHEETSDWSDSYSISISSSQ